MPVMSPPFGQAGTRRAPTTAEQSDGFPCGPLDQALFNELFHRIQAEMKSVLDAAAVSGDAASYANLLAAINQLIANKIPDASDTSGFVTLDQFKARLPIFPEVQTADGKLAFTKPATGTVRLTGGQSFLHRGVDPVVTAETDFTTVASKTYHIRWRKATGWGLFDLADTGYTGGAAETDAALDSTHDDMLAARVTTTAANVATVRPLVNRDRLMDTLTLAGINPVSAGLNGSRFDFNFVWDWARRPKTAHFTPTHIGNAGTRGDDADRGIYRIGDYGGELLPQPERTRYGASFLWVEDFTSSLTILASVGA